MNKYTQQQQTNYISICRYNIMKGWGQAATYIHSLEQKKEKLVKLRGDRFGIAVSDDKWALYYQMVDFKISRILYSLGMFGLLSKSHFNGKEWIHNTKEELKEENKKSIHKKRLQAYRAKNLLNAANMIYCGFCSSTGELSYGEDVEPCYYCQIEGIIPVAPSNLTLTLLNFE